MFPGHLRNKATTKDDNIRDHVTSQYQITTLPNQGRNQLLLFTYNFTTPPCKKFMTKLHLVAFGSNQYTISTELTNWSIFSIATNQLTNNCPTMEVIRTSIAHGGQVPSDIKYGIHPL
ncbi:hypothetical protein DICPUDRAFT_81662 [Dictyostelium purpureum]|uniref:Uncharacterized protein n=1 Tax=Dictyostelium purpureum TaxID=5786 RepID=F0ZU70_DICPU|nr:uncharacterized protein DICPUDRAFT_81662 [Dictyostelium purpureum]EGC32518.1 hypothetical protein DICPUDRAFT_81662 [Dictyostelium purpureum]|eukprot:XP_003290968.1 hypothetical protein DICPUDRAFT_81662 [Dictyostelium purpureum]